MECFAELNVFGENGTPSLDLLGDAPWPEPPKKRGMACCSGEVSYTKFSKIAAKFPKISTLGNS